MLFRLFLEDVSIAAEMGQGLSSGAVVGGLVEEAGRSERRYIGNGHTFKWRVGGGGRIERYGWSRADTNFVQKLLNGLLPAAPDQVE